MLDGSPLPTRRRLPPSLPIILLGVLAAAVLLYLARSMTFWQDEWRVILFQGGALDVLRPLNEHWSTIPLLLYRATFGIVGLHSYLPYLWEVIALHLIAVAAAFLLVRARCGAAVATLACLPLLLPGSGGENLFWAFQTGFVGSVAFGLWALVLLDRPGRKRVIGASILLLASVMSSGMGLVLLVAAFGRTLLDPTARRRAVALVLPVVTYAVWYLAIGHDAVGQGGHLARLTDLIRFAARGVGHAVSATTGVSWLPASAWLGLAIFGVVAVATALVVVRHRPPPTLAAGAILAIVAMYVLIGLVRAGRTNDFATRGRYVYVAVFLVILVIADWLPILGEWVAGRPPWRNALVAALSLVLVAAIAANLVALNAIRERFAYRAEVTRAFIALAVANPGASWIDPTSGLRGMPTVPDLVAVVGRFGSPVRDDLFPGVVRRLRPEAREAALLRMVASAFRAGPPSADGRVEPLPVSQVSGATVSPDTGCLMATPAGSNPSVTFVVRTGSRLQITSTNDVTATTRLGHALPPTLMFALPLTGGRATELVVPDIGDASAWLVRLDVPATSGPVRVCLVTWP